MMYILLKPEATDDVVADFVNAGCISSRYDPSHEIETLSELDLIAGAASLCFDSDCVCLEVAESDHSVQLLEHDDCIQARFAKPLDSEAAKKMVAYLKIPKYLEQLAVAANAIGDTRVGLARSYYEITGEDSEVEEHFYDGLQENERYYSPTDNDELVEAMNEIFEPEESVG
jgi:hypothetical protein